MDNNSAELYLKVLVVLRCILPNTGNADVDFASYGTRFRIIEGQDISIGGVLQELLVEREKIGV
jgi:hypothetical protein